MTQVLTLERFRPIARYDELPWKQARIEEAADPDGPWAAIDTLTLDPVDTDPAKPATRNLTTENAGDGELWYRVVFIDETGDESLPTSPIQNTTTASTLYVQVDQLKASLEIFDSQLDDEIELAVATASRACDEYKSSFGHRVWFYPSTQIRYYTGAPGSDTLDIDALNTVTSVTVDTDGDGVYETTWVRGTDYVLEPTNAAADNMPYTRLRLIRQGGRVFPAYQQSVKITGSFGWAETPVQVKTAAKILAGRLFKRRETPFAFQVLVGETMSAARIGRIDPDVASLLDQVPPFSRPRSLQMR